MRGSEVRILKLAAAASLAAVAAGCPSVYGPQGPAAGASQPASTSQRATGGDPDEDTPPPVAGQPARSPTPSEMASAAQEMTVRMARMVRRAEQRHATAVSANDALRRDCVSERLIQMRGLLTAADTGRARLERAVGQHQLQVSQEEYSGVGVAFLKVKLLSGETRQCMIDPPRIGHTETKVTVEPLKPGDRSATEPSPPDAR
jgi:hypothetical protein